MSDTIPPRKKSALVPKPENDNESCPDRMRVIVTIPKDSPITQIEIEVFSALLDDWTRIPANDNEEVPK